MTRISVDRREAQRGNGNDEDVRSLEISFRSEIKIGEGSRNIKKGEICREIGRGRWTEIVILGGQKIRNIFRPQTRGKSKLRRGLIKHFWNPREDQ